MTRTTGTQSLVDRFRAYTQSSGLGDGLSTGELEELAANLLEEADDAEKLLPARSTSVTKGG